MTFDWKRWTFVAIVAVAVFINLMVLTEGGTTTPFVAP